MGRGKAQRAGRAAQRRQPLEHRPRPLDDQLDHVVERDRDRRRAARISTMLRAVGSNRGLRGQRRATTQIAAVVAGLRPALAQRDSSRASARGSASYAKRAGSRGSAAFAAPRCGGSGRIRRARDRKVNHESLQRTMPSVPGYTHTPRPPLRLDRACATCSASTEWRSARRWRSASAPAPASTTCRSRTPRRAAGSTAAPPGSRRTSAS